ncbi:MAG: glutathione S-transferase family protein [Myxococcales bacterium]|nr:glutathione S-transferase family protein [Myxococcales bacterium]
MLQIYGVPFSAHTRKVIVAAHHKRLPFELSQLVPLTPDLPEWFLRASPLRQIPVVVHGGRTIADSSVIALYLDRVAPERPLYPEAPDDYAKALFIEELVDGALAKHVLHGVLFQRVFGPRFLGLTPDRDLITRSLEEHIPLRLADLEARLEGDWFAGAFSYADITVASMLLNFHYAGEQVSRDTHPRLHALLRRALLHEPFATALRAEAPAARGLHDLDTHLLDELGY